MSETQIPETQWAVQLTGPDQLRLNQSKKVFQPGPRQMLARIEAVGLCFSDLKLLAQFSDHVRKSEIVRGIEEADLKQIPSYVPGDLPTVPGHEVVCRIVSVGSDVTHFKAGDRCLVQADLRQLRTRFANAAFGYNIEGGLQEYVLIDERMVVDEAGEHYLIDVDTDLGASQAALVEPWACVEDSYVTEERRTLKPGGNLAVAALDDFDLKGIEKTLALAESPSHLTIIAPDEATISLLQSLGIESTVLPAIGELPDETFDDIIYFGSDADTLATLNDKLANNGILNVVTGGKEIGRPVSVGVGRVHYAMTRWIGTTTSDASRSYSTIPVNGEIRHGDSILVVGAGGPMGQMHVIRDLCLGRKDLSLVATDFEDARLAALEKKARPFADANGVAFRTANPQNQALDETFSYIAIMAPVGALVAEAVERSKPKTIINIFAGIPIAVRQDIDLDKYIENRCFMYGTSGSSISDMKIVLGKVRDGRLNTNASVDAVSGMAGAIDGIAAVKNRTMAGKIVVYPALKNVGLIALSDLREHFPTVADKLENGQWCKAAEQELLAVAAQ